MCKCKHACTMYSNACKVNFTSRPKCTHTHTHTHTHTTHTHTHTHTTHTHTHTHTQKASRLSRHHSPDSSLFNGRHGQHLLQYKKSAIDGYFYQTFPNLTACTCVLYMTLLNSDWHCHCASCWLLHVHGLSQWEGERGGGGMPTKL